MIGLALFSYGLFFAIVAMAVGCFTSWLADRKGYNGLLWFLLGLVFSFIALIALAGAPVKPAHAQSTPVTPSLPTPKKERIVPIIFAAICAVAILVAVLMLLNK
jgi:multisubunit Na+/H+ antiporter MnhB subunit